MQDNFQGSISTQVATFKFRWKQYVFDYGYRAVYRLFYGIEEDKQKEISNLIYSKVITGEVTTSLTEASGIFPSHVPSHTSASRR